MNPFMQRIDILVPIFNDFSKLNNFFSQFLKMRRSLLAKYEINLVMVDDGSTDNSCESIKIFGANYGGVLLIELSRNFGKEAALFAGIQSSNADALILLDVDLQDPIELVPRLLETWNESKSDSVIARRNIGGLSEKGFRRIISKIYLKIFNSLASIRIDTNVGETRLINSKMIQAFKKLDESNRFTRGLFEWMGFKAEYVNFDRLPSPEKSRYSVTKLFKLAIDGITSFSIKPLRLVAYLGFFGWFLSILFGIFVIFLRLFDVVSMPGYSSTIMVILFGSSLQLLCMGILGEYIGKNLEESKRRPVYIAREINQY